MTEYDQIAEALDELENIISQTRTAIADGDSVELQGLPEFTDSVCRKVCELPDGGGKLFVGRVSQLLEDLDLLQNEVAAKHRDLSARLASSESRQGADGVPRET